MRMKEMIVASSVLILGILLLRNIFRRRIPAGLQCALWLLVAGRLLLPLPEMVYQHITHQEISLWQSPFSVMNGVNWLEEKWGIWAGHNREERAGENEGNTQSKTAEQNTEKTGDNGVAGNVVVQDGHFSQYGETEQQFFEGANENIENGERAVQAGGQSEIHVSQKKAVGGIWKEEVQTVCISLWLAGMLALFLWQIYTMLRFQKSLKSRRRRKEFQGTVLYTVQELSSPCLVWEGAFHPTIYVPEAIARDRHKMEHALLHEGVHQKHGDLWWTALCNVLLIVYWFHPLVWVAVRAFRADCEIWCDECVIRGMDEAERVRYGETLLSLLEQERTTLHVGLTTGMSSGKQEMKERIVRIAMKKKRKAWQLILLVLAAVALTGITFTSAAVFQGEGKAKGNAEKETPIPDKTLTMNNLLEWGNKDLGRLDYQDWLTYTNCIPESESEDDKGCINRYLWFYLRYQDRSYKLGVSYYVEDESIDTIYLVDERTKKSGCLFTTDPSRKEQETNLNDFLNPEVEKLEIDYQVNEQMLNEQETGETEKKLREGGEPTRSYCYSQEDEYSISTTSGVEGIPGEPEQSYSFNVTERFRTRDGKVSVKVETNEEDYSLEEIHQAVEQVCQDFQKEMKNYHLKKISYNKEISDKWRILYRMGPFYKEVSGQKRVLDKGMLLQLTFTVKTGEEGKDLERNAKLADWQKLESTYKDFNWSAVLQEDGSWKTEKHGY